jgi:hypothetical protein
MCELITPALDDKNMMTMVSKQQRGKEHFVIYKGTIMSW